MCAWQLDMLLFLRRYLQHGWFQSSDKKAGHHYKEMPQESSQVSLDLQLSVEESQLFRGAASCTPSQHVETLLQVSSMMWQAARSTGGVGSNSLIQAVPRCSGDLQEYSIISGSDCSHSFCTLLTLQILNIYQEPPKTGVSWPTRKMPVTITIRLSLSQSRYR